MPVKEDLRTFPDWVSKMDAAALPALPGVPGITTGRKGKQDGHLLAAVDHHLYYHYHFSTQPLYPPIATPLPPSSLQERGTVREIKQFLLPKQSCGHRVLCFPSFNVHESRGDLVRTQMRIPKV